MKKIAFIGGGTMGTALASAACRGNDPQDVVVTDIVKEKAEKLAADLGCVAVATNSEAVEAAKYVVFCVKPQFLDNVLREVKDTFAACAARGEKKVIVSIVAGIEVSHFVEMLDLEGKNVSVIRTLPNTACLIGKGFIIIEQGDSFTDEEEAELRQLLREAGGFESLPASMFTAGCVLTSTSPAFIAMFANSLADAGVYNGLLRPQARQLALQGILCATQLFLATDRHLEAYKDDVCSPAGPAMIGVKSLEDSGFRSSVINAVVDAYKRFAEMKNVK